MTSLPSDHPERLALAEEVHGRPAEALGTPERVIQNGASTLGRGSQHSGAGLDTHLVVGHLDG
jgi:hypothetical protein